MRRIHCDMFLFAENRSASAIHKQLQNVLKVMPECNGTFVSAPSSRHVRKHLQRWKRWPTERRFDWWNKTCSACNSQMWLKVYDLWNLGPVGRWTRYQSFSCDHTTHSCHWSYTKMCTKWVSKQFTDEIKRARVKGTWKFLAQHACDPTMISHIVTSNESRIPYIASTRKDTQVWHKESKPALKKFRLDHSTKKILCNLFWDCWDVLSIDF